MKIQIDTTAKTIKLESCEKLSALFDFLSKFFPEGEWEDYELQTNTQIVNWGNPIIVRELPYWVNPYRNYTGNVICGTDITSGGNTITVDENSTSMVTTLPNYGTTVTNCAVTGDACSSKTYAHAQFLTHTSNSVLNFELN